MVIPLRAVVHVNLNTGISHMHSCQNAQGSGKTRVEGVLLPNRNSLRGEQNERPNYQADVTNMI